MSSTPRDVLLIEDDPDIRSVLREVLEVEGHRVTSTASLPDARAILADQRFDILLVDHWLDGEVSDPLVEEISRGSQAPSIIMISAAPSLADVANRYHVYSIRKPFDLGSLLQLVDTAARERRRFSTA